MKKECISKNWFFNGKTVDLPHDYVISNPRDEKAQGGPSTGFFPGESGQYSKYIKFEKEEHVILDIDGAYMCAEVSINEDIQVIHPHGYTPLLVDLTDKIQLGRTNRIGISTSYIQPSTRWYSGAGLYRDVFLWTGGKIRIEPWDLYVVTKEVKGTHAVIEIKGKITADLDAWACLSIKIKDENGNQVLEEKDAICVSEEDKVDFCKELEITDAVLWNVEDAHLYCLEVEISSDQEIMDTSTQMFGIREIKVSAKEGLTVNGKSVKLRGGCIHHDHAVLGAAAFPTAEERKVKKLKAVGFNALRIAHNPPSLALMEVCDREGIFLMDEAFDMWNMKKNAIDYHLWFADWWARDIRYMVKRDRSHPCILSYSIGNEIGERNGFSDGAKWSERLSREIRKYDDSRFVTSGICGMWDHPEKNAPKDYADLFLRGHKDIGVGDVESSWADWTEKYMKPLDIVGYNYLYQRYRHDHELYPERVMWGSETHAMNFFHSWKEVRELDYVIGDFTWTAYDNLGEVGTGRFAWERDEIIHGISLAKYPWRSCYQGDLDLCGYRRPQSYFRETIWRENTEPKIFTTHPSHNGEGFSGTGWHWYDVLDTWNFEDEYLGKEVKAEVYSVADEVRFTLNGKVVGSVKPECGIASLMIPYEKGTLTAENVVNGKVTGTSSLATTGSPCRLKVVAEKASIAADNRDLCYFDIQVEDESGNRVPDAKLEIACVLEGGELLGIFGGDPKNEDQYTSHTCHTFEGRAVAVVRTKENGEVTLTVGGKNLHTGKASVSAI